MTDLPIGTVTFLFTDIEGSTTLLRELRDRYADVLTEYRRLLRAAFQARGGREVNTQGDAFFIAFRSARDAVAAAIDAQRALANRSWPEGAAVCTRMGCTPGRRRFPAAGMLVWTFIARSAFPRQGTGDRSCSRRPRGLSLSPTCRRR